MTTLLLAIGLMHKGEVQPITVNRYARRVMAHVFDHLYDHEPSSVGQTMALMTVAGLADDLARQFD